MLQKKLDGDGGDKKAKKDKHRVSHTYIISSKEGANGDENLDAVRVQDEGGSKGGNKGGTNKNEKDDNHNGAGSESENVDVDDDGDGSDDEDLEYDGSPPPKPLSEMNIALRTGGKVRMARRLVCSCIADLQPNPSPTLVAVLRHWSPTILRQG